MDDDNIILSYGSERGTKVLSHAGDGYIYKVKGKFLTAKYRLSHTDLLEAIDQWIKVNA